MKVCNSKYFLDINDIVIKKFKILIICLKHIEMHFRSTNKILKVIKEFNEIFKSY